MCRLRLCGRAYELPHRVQEYVPPTIGEGIAIAGWGGGVVMLIPLNMGIGSAAAVLALPVLADAASLIAVAAATANDSGFTALANSRSNGDGTADVATATPDDVAGGCSGGGYDSGRRTTHATGGIGYEIAFFWRSSSGSTTDQWASISVARLTYGYRN
uniref:Uncharacterized protein n=1 Tax=Anopheles merus TaxID=30066 RepID=A0A182V5J3_ANOME